MDVSELILSRHLSSFGKIGQRTILSLDQNSGSQTSGTNSRAPSRAGRIRNEDRKAGTDSQWRVAKNVGKSGARRAIVIDQTSQQKETLRRVRDLQTLVKTLQSELADKDERIEELEAAQAGAEQGRRRVRGFRMKTTGEPRHRSEEFDCMNDDMGPLSDSTEGEMREDPGDSPQEGPSDGEASPHKHFARAAFRRANCVQLDEKPKTKWIPPEKEVNSDDSERDPLTGKRIIRPEAEQLSRFRNDDESKMDLIRMTDKLIRIYMRDGSLQKKMLRDELTGLAEKMVLRWGIKQHRVPCKACPKSEARLADVEARFMNVQKDSLKEISILRKKVRVSEMQMEALKQSIGKNPSDSLETTLRDAERKAAELDMRIGGDNELYEPIMSFEEDQRQLMISIINEKVRTILTMDAEAFGGKLPFGLLAFQDKESAAKIAALEAELERAQGQITTVTADYWAAVEERDKLRRENERIGNIASTSAQRGAFSASEADTLRGEHEAEIARLEAKHDEETASMVERYEALIKQLKQEREEAIKEAEELRNKEPAVVTVEAPVAVPQERSNSRERRKQEEDAERLSAMSVDLVVARRQLDESKTELAECRRALEERTAQLEEARRNAAAKSLALDQARAQQGEAGPPGMDTEEKLQLVKEHTEKVEVLENTIEKMTQHCSASMEAANSVTHVVRKFKALLNMPSRAPLVIFGTKGGTTDTVQGKRDSTSSVDKSRDQADVWNVVPQMIAGEVEQLNDIREKIVELTKVRDRGQAEMNVMMDDKRKQIADQKEELQRLQLLVDELRRRVVDVSKAAEEAGVPLEQITDILEASGLKDVVDATDKATAQKVFQRLYGDAMDRLRRYSTIQAKLMAAQCGSGLAEIFAEAQQLEKKFRGVEDYCEAKLQERSQATQCKTLPPDYFMYGWIPVEAEEKPFTRYMKMLEDSKGHAMYDERAPGKLPAFDDAKRPLPAENRLLWKQRLPPRPCEKRPVDKRMGSTWTSFSAADLRFASDDVKRRKNLSLAKLT